MLSVWGEAELRVDFTSLARWEADLLNFRIKGMSVELRWVTVLRPMGVWVWSLWIQCCWAFFRMRSDFEGTLVFDVEGLENGYLKHGNVVIGLIEMIRDGWVFVW